MTAVLARCHVLARGHALARGHVLLSTRVCLCANLHKLLVTRYPLLVYSLPYSTVRIHAGAVSRYQHGACLFVVHLLRRTGMP